MSASAAAPAAAPAPSSEHLWGAVELGGTTIKVALASGCPTNVIQQWSFPTGSVPKVALDTAVKLSAVRHVRELRANGIEAKAALPSCLATSDHTFFYVCCSGSSFEGKPLTALAVGSFGPVDLREDSKTYGFITSTPKAGWQDVDVLSPFRVLGVPLGFSTDVNTAAFGELTLGRHGDGVDSVVYVTVGTGIGCGVVVRGNVLTGLLHPEGGHIPVRPHETDVASGFKGLCPYHGDCLEGLATANSIAARLGIPIEQLSSLPDDHPAWEVEAYYLGQLCATLSLLLSPHVIVLGGGVLHRRILFPLIRKELSKALNGYLRSSRIVDTPEQYVVQSRFDAEGSKTSAGAVGTLAFAKHVWEKQQQDRAKAKL